MVKKPQAWRTHPLLLIHRKAVRSEYEPAVWNDGGRRGSQQGVSLERPLVGENTIVVGKCQAVALKDPRPLNLPRGSLWERSALVTGGPAFQTTAQDLPPGPLCGIAL